MRKYNVGDIVYYYYRAGEIRYGSIESITNNPVIYSVAKDDVFRDESELFPTEALAIEGGSPACRRMASCLIEAKYAYREGFGAWDSRDSDARQQIMLIAFKLFEGEKKARK